MNMDQQKHDILFSDLDGKLLALRSEERNAACIGMGLPIEVPPSYNDSVSYRESHKENYDWSKTLPRSSFRVNQETSRHFQAALPVISEQPELTGQYLGRLTSNYREPRACSSTYSFQTISLTPQPKLGPNPCNISCPACGAHNITQMTYTPNSRTHLCAIALCFLGWCCFACFLPYWMKSCRTGNHYCSECQTFLGSYFPHDKNH